MNNIVLGTMNIEYQYSSNEDKSIESYKDIIEKYILECNENNIYIDTAYYYGNVFYNSSAYINKCSKQIVFQT